MLHHTLNRMKTIERIEHKGRLVAIIVKKKFSKEGLTFVTEDNFALQLGIHMQKKGYLSKPHKHLKFSKLENLEAQEVLFVEKGKVKIGLYDDNGKKIKDINVGNGDIVVLNSGHSVECLNDSKFIEVKQGPYRGQKEKEYFS